MAIENSFVNPQRVVSYLGIEPGASVADFGSGSGFYSIALANAVGPEGKVYAFDIQKEAISYLRSRAKLQHLFQIEAVVADLEREHGTHLKDGSVDLVLLASIVHQAEKKDELVREARRILKTGGRLVIIEWDMSPSAGGPPLEYRVAKTDAKALAERGGFKSDREIETGSFHYGLTFIK